MSSGSVFDRINSLLDAGSFRPILSGVEQHGADMPHRPGDGVVAGFGKIGGRNVAVFAHDPAFAGGSLGEVGVRKIAKLYELATRFGYPIIGLADSSGARIQEGARSLIAVGELIKTANKAHGKIPQINVIIAGGVGGAAFTAAVGDVVIGVAKTGYMFLHGPRAVKHATGQDVSIMELGSVKTLAASSGLIDFVTEDEAQAISLVKKLLSYLPSNYLATPPTSIATESTIKQDLESTETRRLVAEIIDPGTFLEFKADYARNLITGLGRVNGLVVGVVANEPSVFKGYIDGKACVKLSRFVDFCNSFNIPVLTIVDTPGFEPGVAAEHGGIIREGTWVYRSYLNATVPKVTLIAGKAYGGAYIAMCSKGIGADYVLALPDAEVAVQPLEVSAEILFRKELEKLPDDQKAAAFAQYVEALRTKSRGDALLSIGVADVIVKREEVKKTVSSVLHSLYDGYVKNSSLNRS